jgi:hypothetical protein
VREAFSLLCKNPYHIVARKAIVRVGIYPIWQKMGENIYLPIIFNIGSIKITESYCRVLRVGKNRDTMAVSLIWPDDT